MGGGPPYIGQMRGWKDIAVSGAPGQTATVRIPIWNASSLATLQRGAPIACRCILLDPNGRRTIMSDVLVIPPDVRRAADAAMPVGPDAE